MADISAPVAPKRIKIDRVWLVIAATFLAVGVLAPADLWGVFRDTIAALGHTAIFITFAVFAIGYLKATGAESLLAKAFEGNQSRMIVMAALLGGLSPFCSCEVIPFIAAMLALGTPLSAVMAFWLASPLMDPAMFVITTGALGFEFALAKTVAAVALGLFGGFGTRLLIHTPAFVDPLREDSPTGCGCGAKKPFSGKPVWRFWQVDERRVTFWETVQTNAFFLLKWLALAYTFEALMIRYVPAEMIIQTLGGDGIGTITLAALLGMPAYLNGYAAAGLLGGLVDQGMGQGPA
ncbi:MAG: permease, partial [Pseudomonadota bacterium]